MLFGVQHVLIALIIAVALCGDYAVGHSKLRVYKALFDNVTHAVIGGLCWLIVCVNHRNQQGTQTLLEVGLCTAISSLIDLDHFLAAHTLSLANAVQLDRRPPLHATTPPLLATAAALAASLWLQLRWLQRLALIVFTAFLSHHTRDAARRGFWLPPCGSTPPVPYALYVFLTVAIPYLACAALKYARIDNKVHQLAAASV